MPENNKHKRVNNTNNNGLKKKPDKKKRGFISRIRDHKLVFGSAAVIIIVFLILSVLKNKSDEAKLNYNGLGEETDELSYPLSELDNDSFFIDDYSFRSYDDGITTSKRGIDVSEHQGEIDWTKVKDAGVEFAFIRVGYRTYDQGNLKEDSCFRYNIENALANGIDVGVYFFSQAITVEESIEEAKYTIELISDYDITLPIAHDMEEVTFISDRIYHLTRDEKTEIADAFCAIIENYGYDSLVYGNPSWLMTELNIFKLSNRKVWLANYTDVSRYPFRYEIWQYSESGIVDGIDTNVDLNIMFLREE